VDIDELERRTHEQIRDIQEECRQRIAPLVKILTDIHGMMPFTFTEEGDYKAPFGVGVLDNPEYKRAQAELNSTYREMLDRIPVSKTKGVEL
jgi:hypothetical protein